jgi:hypothetical protein
MQILSNNDRINQDALPFRHGVGMMILNKDGKIFVGKRVDSKFEAWQMPCLLYTSDAADDM